MSRAPWGLKQENDSCSCFSFAHPQPPLHAKILASGNRFNEERLHSELWKCAVSNTLFVLRASKACTAHSAGRDLPSPTMNSLSGHRHGKFSFGHWLGEHRPGGSVQRGNREGDGRVPEPTSYTGVRLDSREEWRWASFTLGPRWPNFSHSAHSHQQRDPQSLPAHVTYLHSVEQWFSTLAVLWNQLWGLGGGGG